MWNRKNKKYNTSKLDMFLEDMESNADEMDEGGEDIKRQILALKKQGKTDDEVIEMLASKVGADALGTAWVELKTSGKLTENADADEDDEEMVDESDDNDEDDQEEVEEMTDTDDDADEEPDDDADDVQESFEIGDSPEDKIQMKEAQFTKRDYNVVVDIINNSTDKIVEDLKLKGNAPKQIKEILAKEFSDVFKADNPKFDTERFINAINK